MIFKGISSSPPLFQPTLTCNLYSIKSSGTILCTCVHLNIWYPFIFSLFFIISYHTSITSIIFLYFCFFLSKYRWHWVSNKHYWWSITAQSALGYSPNSNCLPHHIHSEIFVRGKDFFGTDRCRGFEFICHYFLSLSLSLFRFKINFKDI